MHPPCRSVRRRSKSWIAEQRLWPKRAGGGARADPLPLTPARSAAQASVAITRRLAAETQRPTPPRRCETNSRTALATRPSPSLAARTRGEPTCDNSVAAEPLPDRAERVAGAIPEATGRRRSGRRWAAPVGRSTCAANARAANQPCQCAEALRGCFAQVSLSTGPAF